ncbi:molybdopterin-dependent oxidoreductase [Hymenobacter crusticola]|uniref:Molybdopterin-binding oxidoreductase n=1 Tax=Hymenobacter crusticola TaxID=1770526 RepID=A0A243WBR2_9BACT|nr:molybdopterin-dependent oxidoreductase [Hymenobacter crusticola]OUJ73062.1 molybdopterin-binding oxidoreductase [Hymenobacter crusticola]
MANTPQNPSSPPDEQVQREAASRSRRAFLVAGAAALASLGGWRWLVSQPKEAGIPRPLRTVLDANGKLAGEYFSNAHLAPVFPKHLVREPRVNGKIGMRGEFDPAAWRLQVSAYADPKQVRTFSLEDIKALPRVEITTELKCIEGWSVVVNWAGARFSDFADKYGLATSNGAATATSADALAPYVRVTTPDNAYYVGLDIASAMHPQTLLCYEMNGEPLSITHGAPLRLAMPVKYGIKYLKRIGTIQFLDQRPADYWADRGYDWNAGH